MKKLVLATISTFLEGVLFMFVIVIYKKIYRTHPRTDILEVVIFIVIWIKNSLKYLFK